MGEFYNFTLVELVRIGAGPAKIVQITRQDVRYVDSNGAELLIDLEECARTCMVLRRLGSFPPQDDTDWAAIVDANAQLATEDPAYFCVGLRGAVDEPPWFQFLNRRRTQFEFEDYDAISDQLLTPLAKVGWQTWDAS
jgi:hypothetical protein